MTTYTTPPVDVVLEAPVSVGMLAVWAGDRRDTEMSAVVGRALDAGLRAGLRTLQDKGGWAIDGRRYERDRLDMQSYRHYLADEQADVARPHDHLYIAATTQSGLPQHRPVLPDAAQYAQTAYSIAMREQLQDDHIEVIRAASAAGWEIAAVADDALHAPRRTCPSSIPVAEQIVPLQRFAPPQSRTA